MHEKRAGKKLLLGLALLATKLDTMERGAEGREEKSSNSVCYPQLKSVYQRTKPSDLELVFLPHFADYLTLRGGLVCSCPRPHIRKPNAVKVALSIKAPKLS